MKPVTVENSPRSFVWGKVRLAALRPIERLSLVVNRSISPGRGLNPRGPVRKPRSTSTTGDAQRPGLATFHRR